MLVSLQKKGYDGSQRVGLSLGRDFTLNNKRQVINKRQVQTPCEGCIERDNKNTDATMEFLLLSFSELLCLTISFIGCAAQMHLFVALRGAECFLLVAMRCVAICQPLHYVAVMSEGLSLRLAVACCMGGFAIALGLTVAVFWLPFCLSHHINHFCDVPAVLHLACTQNYTPELPLLAACVLLLRLPFLLILTLYVCIAAALLRVTYSVGKGKAFSTCKKVSIALLHYRCATFMYIHPKSSYSPARDKTVSLVYTNIIPLLYPLTSLRNKEIRGILGRMLRRKKIAQLNWDTIRAVICVCGKLW
ncbi:LOW QUALITY PROTEIN: olfactory receptor 10AC1-like [Pterocles gutturalis]